MGGVGYADQVRRTVPYPLLALALVALACQDDDEAFFADDDTAGDDDATGEPPDWEPSGEEGPGWSEPARIDGVHGSTPAILIRDPSLAHVFFNDADAPGGDDGSLYVRDHTGDVTALSEPVSLDFDGFWPRAVVHDDQVHLLGTSRYAIHYLVGDGSARSFETVDLVASTNSGGCDGRIYPSRLAWTDAGEVLLALGYVDHNAVFGCVNHVHFSRLEQGEWTEPAHVGNGCPAGLRWWPDDRLVLAASSAVYTSTDDGSSFDEYLDGDTTQDIVAGADSVQLDDGTILLVRIYSWADSSYLALAAGDPATGEWTSPWVRLGESELGFEDARIARYGDTLVVAWLEARTDEIIAGYRRLQAFTRVSHDNGATWSEESALSVSDPGEQLRELALAVGEGRALAGYVLIREGGAREVYLAEAAW